VNAVTKPCQLPIRARAPVRVSSRASRRTRSSPKPSLVACRLAGSTHADPEASSGAVRLPHPRTSGTQIGVGNERQDFRFNSAEAKRGSQLPDSPVGDKGAGSRGYVGEGTD
jgi:hypothetical protein